MSATRLKIGATTDVGKKRSSNEDSFLVDERLGIFAVADGVGGHSAGEVASFTALEALRAAIASGKTIDVAIAKANTAVYEKAISSEALEGMGTTITALLVESGEPRIAQVGDSRAYLLRAGHLDQITEDHSFVEELVREGQITPEQAEVHPRRAVITRALGIEQNVDVDIFALHLRAADRVLLCSDGLTGMIRPEQIQRILELEEDPKHAAESLADAANAAGGEDNITAVVIDVMSVPEHDAGLDEHDPVERLTPRYNLSGETPAKEKRARKQLSVRGLGAAGAKLARWMAVIIPIGIVVGLGIGAVSWWAHNTYYVDIKPKCAAVKDSCVALYKGVPGGVLGWDPTLEEETNIKPTDLTSGELRRIEAQRQFSSEDDAAAFIADLQDKVLKRRVDSTTTTLPAPAVVP